MGRKEVTAQLTKYSAYKCVFKCFRKVLTESRCPIVGGKVFRIDDATREKAFAHLAFFETFTATRSCDDDRRSHADL